MIYIDNDLPISKDLLMLVIGETEGVQVNVRPVYKPKTDEVKKNHFTLEVTAPIPGTRMVGEINLNFFELLPNTLVLQGYHFRNADMSKEVNKSQSEKIKSLINSWLIPSVFQENPSPNTDMAEIEVCHLYDYKGFRKHKLFKFSGIYYSAFKHEIEPLFKSSYTINGRHLKQRFYFYQNAVYVKGELYPTPDNAICLKDNSGQVYTKFCDWCGTTPLAIFSDSRRGAFSVENFSCGEGLDLKQLAEIKQAAFNTNEITFGETKLIDESLFEEKVVIYSEKMRLTTPIKEFSVGDYVKVKTFGDDDIFKIIKKDENNHYSLMPEGHATFDLNDFPKGEFPSKPFNQLEKVEAKDANTHTGNFLVVKDVFSKNTPKIRQVEVETPNYFYCGKSKLGSCYRHSVVHKSNVISIHKTLESAEEALKTLLKTKEEMVRDFLNSSGNKVSNIITSFIDALEGEPKQKAIEHILEISKLDESMNRKLKLSLDCVVNQLKDNYL